MWQEKNDELYKQFEFKDFKEAFGFMKQVAEEAERRQHHPKWSNKWNSVRIWLTTHDEGNKVTEKDREMAKTIDNIASSNPDELKSVSGSKPKLKIKLYSDGGSRGNPGPSASGFVLLDQYDEVIRKGGVYLGITTNNQAEYRSLKFGLEEAQKIGASEVDVYMDSLLVINQLKGKFKVKNRDLWPIYEEIRELAKHFKKVNYSHVPRELNKLADAEVNETLDAEKNKN